jgi:hypothetical protein
MDSEAFIITVTGRRPATALIAENRITLTGETTLAHRAVDSLNIMI